MRNSSLIGNSISFLGPEQNQQYYTDIKYLRPKNFISSQTIRLIKYKVIVAHISFIVRIDTK